jgi:hypothetical protein
MTCCHKFDIAVHWRDSFACEFVTNELKVGLVKAGNDCLLKLGGLVIIVSKFDKAHQRS